MKSQGHLKNRVTHISGVPSLLPVNLTLRESSGVFQLAEERPHILWCEDLGIIRPWILYILDLRYKGVLKITNTKALISIDRDYVTKMTFS